MKKIRCLLDMDGVICSLIETLLERYRQETNEIIKYESITRFDLFSLVKFPTALNKILLEKSIFSKPAPYKDVMDYLPKLLNDPRFEIFVVTQSPRDSQRASYEKRMWLKNHFAGLFDQENFITTHKKFMICGNLLLDDHPRHLEEFKKEDSKRLSVCMNQPWNQEAECDYRVNDWEEFSELLEKLWEEKWDPSCPKGCNRHEDCSKKKEGSECCFDACCKECFGY